jgi:hypothetical protein
MPFHRGQFTIAAVTAILDDSLLCSISGSVGSGASPDEL